MLWYVLEWVLVDVILTWATKIQSSKYVNKKASAIYYKQTYMQSAHILFL